MNKTLLIIALTWLTNFAAFAQSGDVEMATGLRSSGKIWVVVLVVLTLFIGLFIYMFTLDRKIKKLEKDK
ncbi:CcmD family protein [Sphingobacterium sp. SGG-5]|uniref:CcmD family protein n=1 Tax=Sphingobacterium sp. SGG-5 TaxID=2710881 RepID=UPI0013ED0162|nr:CcmD family protein [Sphingobacterium sp. SGG-5]NGM62579.1 CcmD family protein [Sphingobacterium sp. SGG-5]